MRAMPEFIFVMATGGYKTDDFDKIKYRRKKL
jgi:hypothetical protein